MSDSIVSVPIPNHKLFKNLTGNRFGRWTVISFAGFRSKTGSRGRAAWNCRCDCGSTGVVLGQNLRNGESLSCSCVQKECVSGLNLKHGHSRRHKTGQFKQGTSEYATWTAMRSRCNRPADPCYRHYGGRGIKVCDRWNQSFEAFICDMGARPDGMSLDRIDNNAGYSPENCRWASRKEQSRNLRSNVFYELNGERKTMPEWAEISGIKLPTLQGRLRKMSLGEALFIRLPRPSSSQNQASFQC